jgi:imidazole glycerol-phosphate synthase subunit HisH
MNKVCILDYGSGNVRSVYNAFSQFSDTLISNLESDIIQATHVVLPGVGSYAAAMNGIRKKFPLVTLRNELSLRKPFLGICVGMQVLSTIGFEFEECKGLDLIPGEVREMESDIDPIPHVGWNNLENIADTALLADVNSEDDFYFVHSYSFHPVNPSSVLATTNYGKPFPSVVGCENIFGVQFHPEKSQSSGKKIIRNFLELS